MTTAEVLGAPFLALVDEASRLRLRQVARERKTRVKLPVFPEPKYQCCNWIDENVMVGNAPFDREGLCDILEDGITRFVCLCHRSELRYDYFGLFVGPLASLFDLCYTPVQDESVLEDTHAAFVVDWIIRQTRDGKKVYIHCLGGIGRAGTIASLYLGAKYKLRASVAMAMVDGFRRRRRLLNHPLARSPQSAVQRTQVGRMLDASDVTAPDAQP